jgi:hypothetical protein
VTGVQTCALPILAIVILSFGPAGILAVLSTIRQGYLSKQPNTVGMGILCGILAIFAISSWSENVILFSEIILFLGISLLILCSLTIKFRGERWTMMLAIDSHILIITGIMGMMYFNQIYSTILILSMSTVMWVVGILQVRRIFRIWGLVDLIMAILLSLIFVSGIFDPTNLLICLTVLAIELGVIGWLGILNEKELLKD